MLTRKIIAALLAIILFGTSNIFREAKMDYKIRETITTSKTEEEIFNLASRSTNLLFRDIDGIGELKNDLSYPGVAIKTDTTLTAIEPYTRTKYARQNNHFSTFIWWPDRAIEALSREHFEEYVKQSKSQPEDVKPTAPKQITIEATSRPMVDMGEKRICDLIDTVCLELDFDQPALIKAMVKCESNFDKTAVSSAGCKGLMQITPRYFGELMKEYGVTDLCADELGNIRIGVHWMRYLITKYGSDHHGINKALVAYNCGESVVDKKGLTSSGYSNKILRIVGDYM